MFRSQKTVTEKKGYKILKKTMVQPMNTYNPVTTDTPKWTTQQINLSILCWMNTLNIWIIITILQETLVKPGKQWWSEISRSFRHSHVYKHTTCSFFGCFFYKQTILILEESIFFSISSTSQFSKFFKTPPAIKTESEKNA